ATDEPLLLHQPDDPLPAHVHVLLLQLAVDARTAVVRAAALVGGVDEDLEPLVLLVVRALWPLLPGVEPRPRHTQGPAQLRCSELGLLRGDERELHAFSFAKKAAAFFRISRSSRSSRFSLRSRASSSFSSVVSVPRVLVPRFARACS